MITHYRVKFHRQYLTECLDTLLLKNRPGAMIAQPRGGERRFTLDSRLLEVLLQLSSAERGQPGQLLTRLRCGSTSSSTSCANATGSISTGYPTATASARRSSPTTPRCGRTGRRSPSRLREIGFYSDLSDAYLTQTITPRYTIEAGA